MMTLTERLTLAIQHSRIMQEHRQTSRDRRKRAEQMVDQIKRTQRQDKVKV